MYVLNIDKLERGDIILMKEETELSRRIQLVTNSEFSHALIYVGASSCIESDGYGVQALNPKRLLFKSPDQVKVLRVKSKKGNIDKVIQFVRQKIGTGYSLHEAKMSLLKSAKNAKEKNRQYCTRLVAQAYSYGGMIIVDNVDYCHPGEIIVSSKLKEVPNCVVKASKEEINFAKSDNPLDDQVAIHNEILSKARKITGHDIQDFQQLTQYLISNSEYDSDITNVLKKSGYLDFWRIDCRNNPWYYNTEKFLEKFTNPIEAIATATFFAAEEKKTRIRYVNNLNFFQEGYNISRLDYLYELITLYKKLIELSKLREKVGREVLEILERENEEE